MPTDSSQDEITRAFLSGSTYDRVRYERHSYVRQPIPRTLALQSALLGVLAMLLPMYGLFPESAATYLPSTDPAVASPKVILLGVFGGILQVLGAVLLVGAAAYRVRKGALTEQQAHSVLNTEDFARYVGLGTGGLAILVCLALFAVGLGGGPAITSYVETLGENPFVASGYGLAVADVSLVAFLASLTVFYAGQYLDVLLDLERLAREQAD